MTKSNEQVSIRSEKGISNFCLNVAKQVISNLEHKNMLPPGTEVGNTAGARVGGETEVHRSRNRQTCQKQSGSGPRKGVNLAKFVQEE